MIGKLFSVSIAPVDVKDVVTLFAIIWFEIEVFRHLQEEEKILRELWQKGGLTIGNWTRHHKNDISRQSLVYTTTVAPPLSFPSLSVINHLIFSVAIALFAITFEIENHLPH